MLSVTAAFGLEAFALPWLSEILKSVIAAVAGDRLKKPSSTQRGSLLARNLYVALMELEEASKDFVEALSAVADGGSNARAALNWTFERAAKASLKVARAADKINPQLCIYVPEIALNIAEAPVQRGRNIGAAELALHSCADEEQAAKALREVAQEARQTLTEIEAASEAFRKFLTEQFKFSENF